MKFRVALTLSVVLHVSLFLMIMVVPDMDAPNGTTYYVDLISLPGGGSGTASGGGPPPAQPEPDGESSLTAPAQPEPEAAGAMRDLAVKKAPEASLRYPDKKSRGQWKPSDARKRRARAMRLGPPTRAGR